ncbi:hypothetical protein D516_3773 [Rhodobacter sp. AKP1]|nr:hypothetical protein D516_3773 [Rhodobacter sp. AKP1]
MRGEPERAQAGHGRSFRASPSAAVTRACEAVPRPLVRRLLHRLDKKGPFPHHFRRAGSCPTGQAKRECPRGSRPRDRDRRGCPSHWPQGREGGPPRSRKAPDPQAGRPASAETYGRTGCSAAGGPRCRPTRPLSFGSLPPRPRRRDGR